MPREQSVDWQAPPFETPDPDKLAWLKEMPIGRGQRWVEAQTASSDIRRGIELLSGISTSKLSDGWAASPFTTGELKRDFREVVESLADIRLSFAGYQTRNRAFLEHADMMNKVGQVLYLKSFV